MTEPESVRARSVIQPEASPEKDSEPSFCSSACFSSSWEKTAVVWYPAAYMSPGLATGTR